MEFWPENQGQSSLYSKFGTVPGRNCTHNYHDRHQANHYPLYYGEQQDQGRESSYWTVPGSRTGGAPQEYTNWMDQDLRASHFPFILDRHPQQHQDLGEYQPHEARDREWTAAQRAAREYERGFLREGWQRRWEPCSPVRYNREVSTKRSDSSYRELEAWAARYSHSLPRRRRIEAELRGASQGLLEGSRAPERDGRSGTDPRVAALQQVLQSANIRESGLWDRGARHQAYYPPQTPATDTSHMLDIKEKTGYQRRMFSQPPGYIAPPPYNSPHKSSPVLHHSDTSWEQEGKRQTYWSQPTLRKQDVSVDVQDDRQGEKEYLIKPDGNQYTFRELEGLKHQREETDALQASSPTSILKTHIECEDMSQQPQVLQAVLNKKINEEPSSKVIEGRKFRLNKKTGGLTIFCLVSRIADTTETPCLPLCASQTNVQNTELGGVSKGDINETPKLADEVDFRAPTLTEQSNTSNARNHKAQQKETPTSIEREMLEDNLSNKAEADVAPEKEGDADASFGREVGLSVQPTSVKYPLWREPSFTSRAETESLSTCLKANSKEGESDVLHNQEDSARVHPIDVEVRRLDIMKDTESEDKGLLLIDTTCVVVKMELIPSPKKDHVHYLDSTPHTEQSPLDIQSTITPECAQSNSEVHQDATNDQKAETNPLDINERPETEVDSDLIEEKALEEESEVSFPCMSSSSVSERETLEERAERILGIPLHDCITEKQPEEHAKSLFDSCVEDEEVEHSPIKDNIIDDAVEQLPEHTTEEEQSQNQLEVGQTEDAVCLLEDDDAKDQEANEGLENFAEPQEYVSHMSEENDIDSQLETDIKPSPEIEMTEELLLKSTSEEGATENQPAENDSSSQHPSQSLSPPTDLSNSSSLLSSFLDCETTNPALSLKLPSSDLTSVLYSSESNIEEGPDAELIAFNSAETVAPYPGISSLPHTPSQQLPSPLPPGSTDFSPIPTTHTEHSPSPSPLDLMDRTAEAGPSGVEDQDEEGETINTEISVNLEDLAKDMAEELVEDEDPTGVLEQPISQENVPDSQTQIEVNILQQFDNDQEKDDSCLKETYITEQQSQKEVDEDPSDHIMEETFKISQENVKEVNILQQQLECVRAEDVVSLKESNMTEEQSQKQADEDPTGLLEQTISKENATDSQTQIEIVQDIEPETGLSKSSPPTPSDSDCEVSQSPLDVLPPSVLPSSTHASHRPDTEFVSLLEMDSALNPDAAPAAFIPETVPPVLHLECCEQSLQFASCSSFDSPQVLLPSSSTPPPQEGSPSVPQDLPLKDEPQCPRSLWDAVNRIRKHTAPDSENEEEEMSELWDPESIGEDMSFQGMVVDMKSERVVFDEAGQQEVSTEGSVEDVDVRQIQQDPSHKETSGHAEDDTLSCSSTSSHGSGDTVIVAEEDEGEEMPPDASTGSKTENDVAEGEQCCSDEVKDETAAKEQDNGADESITSESSQSEEFPVEVANLTMKSVEMSEKDQKENEEEVFMPSKVSDEGMIESESVK